MATQPQQNFCWKQVQTSGQLARWERCWPLRHVDSVLSCILSSLTYMNMSIVCPQHFNVFLLLTHANSSGNNIQGLKSSSLHSQTDAALSSCEEWQHSPSQCRLPWSYNHSRSSTEGRRGRECERQGVLLTFHCSVFSPTSTCVDSTFVCQVRIWCYQQNQLMPRFVHLTDLISMTCSKITSASIDLLNILKFNFEAHS